MTEYIETGYKKPLGENTGQSFMPQEYTDGIKKADFARRFIETCVIRYKLFIDTCSLLDPCANKFWDNVLPFLRQYDKHIIVPARCVEELDKQAANKTDTELALRAQRVHEHLYELVIQHFVQVHGEKTDSFADSVFLSVGAKFRMMYDMMLITQDRTLGREFEALGDSQAVRTSRSIIARRINRFGFLSPFRDIMQQSLEGRQDDEDEYIDDEQPELITIERSETDCKAGGAQ